VGVERGSAGCLFLTALPRPNLFCHAHATSLARQGTATAQRPNRRRASALDASAAASTGVQFRRQHPIGPYIVDFCCVERMMVVELDGGQHEDQRARDEARTQWLAAHGFRLLRFSDREALMQMEAVLAEIQNRL
jgi:very-short-patch-repair endonuclease